MPLGEQDRAEQVEAGIWSRGHGVGVGGFLKFEMKASDVKMKLILITERDLDLDLHIMATNSAV